MKEQNVVTLPVTKENVLEGLITIGDIAKSYFQVYDSTILATAQTRYQNIVDTLEGTVVAGEADGIFKEGKVVIAAANPDMMENYIGTGDIVILGNRYEAQLCAIEMEAGCLIICEGAQVSKTITKVAKEHNCLLITTKFDTYTVARLINQSMPIRFLMKEKEGIVKFQTEDFIEDIQTVMAKLRHRDFPVEDTQGNYVGMISRRNLLGAGKKKLILVDTTKGVRQSMALKQRKFLKLSTITGWGQFRRYHRYFLEISRLAVRQRLFIICIRKIRRKLIKIQRHCCVRQSFPIH